MCLDLKADIDYLRGAISEREKAADKSGQTIRLFFIASLGIFVGFLVGIGHVTSTLGYISRDLAKNTVQIEQLQSEFSELKRFIPENIRR